MLFTLSFEMLFGFSIGIALILLIFGSIVFLTVKAVQLSKVTVSLVIAVLLNQTHPIITESRFLGFAVWALICLACCFLLCLLPRCNLAFRFFCTAIVTVIIGMAIVEIAGEIIPAWGNVLAAHRKGIHIFSRFVCLALTALALVQQADELYGFTFENVILVNIERLLASVLYGFGFIFLTGPVDNLWNYNIELMLILGIIGSFVLDFFLSKKFG